MSNKKIRTCCLVIDACIAEAAGSFESRHPTNARCREFLIKVRGICYRMAWNQAIKAEWDRHQRAFSTKWLASMIRLRKLQPIKDELLEELREAIEGHSKDPSVVAKMLNDVHLVEAALATDMRLASYDDNARGHFSRLAATYDSLLRIVWVNPVVEEEQVIEWLEDGARNVASRRLKPK